VFDWDKYNPRKIRAHRIKLKRWNEPDRGGTASPRDSGGMSDVISEQHPIIIEKCLYHGQLFRLFVLHDGPG